MARSPSRLRLALPGLLALALAGCAEADRGRGGDLGDILGGVLGGGGGGDARGSGGDVLGGVLGGVLGRRTVYRCDDHRGFSAASQPLGGGVSVEAEGETYQLRPRGSGNDGEYESADGEVRLRVEGDTAELSVGGQDGPKFENCRAENEERPR